MIKQWLSVMPRLAIIMREVNVYAGNHVDCLAIDGYCHDLPVRVSWQLIRSNQ